MYYIYFEGKIVLIFRKVNKKPEHNGIWIATPWEDHASLMAEIQSVTDFDFGEEVFEPNWLLLQDGHEDFEDAAISIGDLVCPAAPASGLNRCTLISSNSFV